MSRLAVIVTAYGERGAANLPGLVAALAAQTRQPDEVWWMTEGLSSLPPNLTVIDLPTPRDASGRYAEIPYSRKINHALDFTEADYVAYLTDDSLPHQDKYARMAAALDEHPEWGAVYCSQDHDGGVRRADRAIEDAYCVVDHTQVMHRLTADRWPTDVGLIRLGDAHFWRALHRSLGPFYPIPDVLDSVRQTPEGISATY